MSLSDDLRNELAAIAPTRDCDRLAELSGLFHSAGSVHFRGAGRVSLRLDVASPAVARRAFALLREAGVEAGLRRYRARSFDRALRYQLDVPGDARALVVLREAGILDDRLHPRDRPPPHVVRRDCCRGAYLRGALLAGGSLSGPRAPHLEIRTARVETARFLAAVAKGARARLSVRDRERHAAAYAKGADAIGGVLAAAGARAVVLGLEERSVLGATRSRANRLANADHANLVRASRAAHAQILAVRELQRAGRLEELPPALREIARLRVRYPTLPLRELGDRCDPPATKAAVHRRLRKLVDLAASGRAGGEAPRTTFPSG